jgi:hypothetical protein
VIPEEASAAPVPETKALGHEREYVLTFGPRRYRVRGLEKNLSYEVLKVNLLASAPASDGVPGGEAVHIDTLDLYQARARAAFVKAASVELGVAEEIIKGDVGRLLLVLEIEQEKLISAAQQPQEPVLRKVEGEAYTRALELLKSACRPTEPKATASAKRVLPCGARQNQSGAAWQIETGRVMRLCA